MFPNVFKIGILCFLLVACKVQTDKNSTANSGVEYAVGFNIEETNNGYQIILKHTNDTLLLSRTQPTDNEKHIIHIPIEKNICFSTTYVSFITSLNEVETIKGISGLKYVCNPLVVQQIDNNNIQEVGFDKQLDYEKIIAIHPDVVFAFGVDNESLSGFQKLMKLGIPIVLVDDYLESQPLGRTEWIKFFACFYDKLPMAQNYFDSVAAIYQEIKAKPMQHHPNVLVGLPWKGTWWVPGGDSFFANFIKDAGGVYATENTSTESVPYSLEQIFATASDADIWLNVSEKTHRSQIAEVDRRLEKFQPYQKARIYNNNKIVNPYGGCDFWESGIVHPEVILQDLRNIFEENDSCLFYYVKLD